MYGIALLKQGRREHNSTFHAVFVVQTGNKRTTANSSAICHHNICRQCYISHVTKITKNGELTAYLKKYLKKCGCGKIFNKIT